MASTVSWGQRKALGRRYSVDPALTYEQQKLEQEYALIPGREARGLQAQGQAIQQDQFNRQLASTETNRLLDRQYQEERDKQAGKSSMIGTAGNVLTTGMLLKSMMGKSATPAVTPTVSGTQGIDSAPTAMETGIGSGAQTSAVTPALVDSTVAPSTGISGGAGVMADAPAYVAPEAVSATGYTAGAGAAGEAAAGGSSASGASLGPIGMAIAGALMTKDNMAKYARGGSDERNPQTDPTGYIANVSQTPVNSVLTPGQALVDLNIVGKDTAFGKIVGAPGKVESWIWQQMGCIIVTACTDPYSEEVNLTREYRDAFMTFGQLRGYYMIAEAIMPWVVRHKSFVKRQLVDRLVEYGRYHLGKTSKAPSWASCAVTRGFLGLCGIVGSRRKSFIRCNGETV